jgi:DHA1 family tetracycline resistance protein-like MFS transporter
MFDRGTSNDKVDDQQQMTEHFPTENSSLVEQRPGVVDPYETVQKRSINRKRSFLHRIAGNLSLESGIPQIVGIALMLAMAFGSTIGIIPSIMTERIATLRYEYDGPSCHTFLQNDGSKPIECILGSNDAQTAASISEMISNTLTLITSSLIGSMSDLHGRRTLFILGILISLLGPLSLLWTVLMPKTSALIYYGAKSLNGLIHWMVIALSSIADTIPPRQRAAGVGLLMAGFWLGLCLAPTLAVFMDRVQVVFISCALHFMALVVAILFVPETLPLHAIAQEVELRRQQNSEQTYEWKDHKFKYLLFIANRPIRELSIINRNSFLRLLSALAFFSGMATSGDQTLLLYYVDSVLSFTSMDIAVMFLLVGMSAVFAQAILLRPLNDCIGERLIVVVCFIAATMSNTMYGLARNRKELYIGVCFGALSGMAFPTISAIKANNVGSSEQGRIQGALFSIQAVSAGIGPIAMRSVDSFAKRSGSSPGTMFFFAAFLQFVALCCACRLPKDKANSRSNIVDREDDPCGETSST